MWGLFGRRYSLAACLPQQASGSNQQAFCRVPRTVNIHQTQSIVTFPDRRLNRRLVNYRADKVLRPAEDRFVETIRSALALKERACVSHRKETAPGLHAGFNGCAIRFNLHQEWEVASVDFAEQVRTMNFAEKKAGAILFHSPIERASRRVDKAHHSLVSHRDNHGC
jgi:hypothetical protein